MSRNGFQFAQREMKAVQHDRYVGSRVADWTERALQIMFKCLRIFEDAGLASIIPAHAVFRKAVHKLGESRRKPVDAADRCERIIDAWRQSPKRDFDKREQFEFDALLPRALRSKVNELFQLFDQIVAELGWLWGIAGALLAVPILASVKIICDRFESLKPVAEFLSP